MFERGPVVTMPEDLLVKRWRGVLLDTPRGQRAVWTVSVSKLPASPARASETPMCAMQIGFLEGDGADTFAVHAPARFLGDPHNRRILELFAGWIADNPEPDRVLMLSPADFKERARREFVYSVRCAAYGCRQVISGTPAAIRASSWTEIEVADRPNHWFCAHHRPAVR